MPNWPGYGLPSFLTGGPWRTGAPENDCQALTPSTPSAAQQEVASSAVQQWLVGSPQCAPYDYYPFSCVPCLEKRWNALG